MNNTNILTRLLSILITTTISIGVLSCKDGKLPEPEISDTLIMGGKWCLFFYRENIWQEDIRYYVEFEENGNYSYVTENENIHGIFRIKEKEKTTSFTYISRDNEVTLDGNGTLFKMMASGSNSYDNLWVHHRSVEGTERLIIRFYSGNNHIQDLVFKRFDKP